MHTSFKNILVGVILSIIYWFFIVYFGDFFTPAELRLFIPFGILVTVLGALIGTRDSDTMDNWEFWVPVAICFILIAIIAATGAQHKIDPPTWLNKK